MIDPKFTEKIALWLQSDHKSDENIKEGAMLLLQLNRDQAMYQRIIRRPQRELKFLEYKLQRFLKLRNDGKTVSDVVKLDQEIIPHLQAIINAEPVPVEGQAVLLPVEQPAEQNGGNEIYVRKGIRPDHDKLPENIQAIWTKNAERWKKIKEAFETCKNLTEPCDRYEYLKVLKETWYKYKDEMARYDEYRLSDDSQAAGNTPSLTPDQEKELANADSYISKNLPLLRAAIRDAMQAGNYSEEDAREIANRIERLQQRVDVLIKYGRTFTSERQEQLLFCSIRLNSNEQGQKSE
jgi:hypothetical protein